MKEYKVFTVFKPQNDVVLEVWLEDNLNKFASEGWSFKEMVSLPFKEDALGIVILEKPKKQ